MKSRFVLFISVLLFSCGQSSQNNPAAAPANTSPDWVMTKALQQKFTPDTIITILKNGNTNFSDFKLTPKNDSMRMRITADSGQYPMAAVLSCLDARVPPEHVFDRGIGDLFIARVAGNFANTDILGSLEYACRVSGSKVILVLGHENCGAIKSAIDNVRLGNITAMLRKLKPAVDSTHTTGERNSKNKQFVHDVAVKNIEFTIKKIRADSPILDTLEKEGKLKIIGGMYDLANGKITFY
ncbi:carbonic anhydrase family protein [Mucilaginibacter sp.]|uniref:carbonic anhydrase family protein n=1 Tax=Mucilaginibacter sp. TaxID=1882438 RepID=UPI00284C5B95|nr:carbonic anhydrase family protein [Mucilaginibacter sp.]MDR3695641.1 carbonic anhydrase family protein [Mucilaginibacter sp.]